MKRPTFTGDCDCGREIRQETPDRSEFSQNLEIRWKCPDCGRPVLMERVKDAEAAISAMGVDS